MEHGPTPPHDPFASVTDPGERYALAVRLVEFAHARYPRTPMSGPCLDAAHAWIRKDPGASETLRRLEEKYDNLTCTAGWLGLKTGDPTAATCIAAHALARHDDDVLERVYNNLTRMIWLAERRGDATVRGQFELLMSVLREQGSQLG